MSSNIVGSSHANIDHVAHSMNLREYVDCMTQSTKVPFQRWGIISASHPLPVGAVAGKFVHFQ